MVDWVSQAEAARRLGLSAQYVGRKVKAGVFVLNKYKMLDFEQVSRDYVPHKKHLEAARAEPAPKIERKNSASDPDYWAARTRRETSEANISEIRQQELKDSLVAKESVRRTVYEVLRGLRDALSVVPRRLSGELVACTDPEECISIIDKELKHVLQAVSDDVRKSGLE